MAYKCTIMWRINSSTLKALLCIIIFGKPNSEFDIHNGEDKWSLILKRTILSARLGVLWIAERARPLPFFTESPRDYSHLHHWRGIFRQQPLGLQQLECRRGQFSTYQFPFRYKGQEPLMALSSSVHFPDASLKPSRLTLYTSCSSEFSGKEVTSCNQFWHPMASCSKMLFKSFLPHLCSKLCSELHLLNLASCCSALTSLGCFQRSALEVNFMCFFEKAITLFCRDQYVLFRKVWFWNLMPP